MKTSLSLVLACVLLLPCLGLAQSVAKCSWDANPEAHVTGYRVLYGTNSQQWNVTHTVVGRLNTSLTVSNLPVGVTYWVVQALAEGISSSPSFEVLWTNAPPPVVPVPPSAPRGFKLSSTTQAGPTPTGPWTNLAESNIPMPPMPPTNQTARFFRSTLLLKELP